MKAQKGFVEGTLPQLLLVLISFAVIAMIISNIFSGTGGIQEKLCLAVPFFCGTQTGIDYEISERSTNAMACAIGSAFTETKWQGSNDFTCEEFYTQPATGAGVSGAATSISGGPASAISAPGAGEEPLTLQQLRKLKPTVSCSKDNNGKMNCILKNLVMPQEISTWENWIPYWGDPNYLIYWNTFPTEEDTWNFKIEWGHHILIAALAILPVGKSISVGVKTFWTAIKGPSKKLLAARVAPTLFKPAENYIAKEIFGKIGQEVASNPLLTPEVRALLSKAGASVGTDLSNELAQLYGEKVLSKLTKKELKTVLEQTGIKYGRVEAVKDVMRRGLVDILKKRYQKLGVTHLAIMGGKFATMELALNALADSSMRKYIPVGNAIAIKNPQLGEEDRKIFDLPEGMKDTPVLVQWKPIAQPQAVLKNAHFVSPCYLNEFSVSKESIVCGKYNKIKTDEGKSSLSCEGIFSEGSNPDRYKCGVVDWNAITSHTREDMGEAIKGLIDNDDKKLFEINDIWATGELEEAYAKGNEIKGVLTPEEVKEQRDEILKSTGTDLFEDYYKWKLEKIYLPWLSTEYFTFLVPKGKYYLENIKFQEGELVRNVGNLQRLEPIQIGEKIGEYVPLWDAAGGYTEIYTSDLGCGEDCHFLVPENNKNDVIMSSGKEYLIYMVMSKGGVDVSIYDVGGCTEVSGFYEQEKGFNGVMKCDAVKQVAERIKQGKGVNGEVAALGRGSVYEYDVLETDLDSQISKIRQYVKDFDQDTYTLRIVPKGDIKAEDISYYNGAYVDSFTDCSKGGMDKGRVCIRTFRDAYALGKNIQCKGTGKESKTNEELLILTMDCDIKLPQVFQKPLYFEENKEIVGVALSIDFMVNYNASNQKEWGKVIDKTYSSLTFRSGKEIFVQFGDADEDGNWDEIGVEKGEDFMDKIKPDCLFGESKKKFKIKFSDIGIGENKNKNYEAYPIYMENCKTDAVIIKFKDDAMDKINTNEKNYCLKTTKGVTRVLNANFCGFSIANVVATAALIGSFIVADGAGAGAVAAAMSTGLLVTSAGTEIYADVSQDIQQMWPH